ncbi:hypothetical protein [Desertimonas flava]|uniref:hypothetical protein n=1 Tax=Desertimonas flava TaxID=2064846 RepID=UPI000E34AD35|nr:hypothetical protein [Desertimonas flava]
MILATGWSALLAAASADTAPPADDRLYAPHPLSGLWLAIGIGALLAGAALAVWIIRPRRHRSVEIAPPATIHDVYLHRIDELGARLAGGDLDERHLHHELARTLRSYAGDTGTTGADAMSASALDSAGRRRAAAAVRSFEQPQFAESASADTAQSLRVARDVITEDDADASRMVPGTNRDGVPPTGEEPSA